MLTIIAMLSENFLPNQFRLCNNGNNVSIRQIQHWHTIIFQNDMSMIVSLQKQLRFEDGRKVEERTSTIKDWVAKNVKNVWKNFSDKTFQKLCCRKY